ncbi:MAG: dienelactone hydrolase family protein [Gallionella sp.]|nr:dienelactone hydrolase family protein [Gallionella sp.]MDP1941128.1 dienelactone hydrolase family protein [Gallionella sp.]
MTAILSHIALESGKQPQYSIIWLHGLGADGQDFVPMVDELKLPVAVRYLFPHAPKRPVTINGGFVMRAWYDIASDKIDAQQDSAGIRASQADVEALIAQEVSRGILPQHIFLAGFSQGGAIALHTALRQTVPLAGVLALSTYLPLPESTQAEATTLSRQTPIFMAHGRNDTVVPCSLGAASRVCLLAQGYTVAWHEYAMQHSVNERELRDIEAWLKNRMEKQDRKGLRLKT